MKKVYSILLLSILFLFGMSQNPQLDISFGDKGFFQKHYGEGNVNIIASALQSDGKIVLAGYVEKQVHSLPTKSWSLGNWNAFLGRIFPNGKLDSTFGKDGFITLSFGNLNDRFSFVHTDSLDRIYVIEDLQNYRTIGRFLPDGQPDSSYGINGFYNPANLLNGSNHVVNDVSLLPDRSTVLVGANQTKLSVTKLKPNGFPDSTFDWTGQVTSQFLPAEPVETAVDVAVQYDSLLLVLGASLDDGYITRYLPDGRVDPNFGDNGHKLISFTQSLQNLEKIYVYPDQRFIVAARLFNRVHLFAFTSNGQPDSSRFVNGQTTQNITLSTYIEEIYVAQNGDIFLLDRPQSAYLTLTKLSSSGLLDSTFGYAGQMRLQIENRNTYAHSLQFLPGDSLLVLANNEQRITTIKLDPQGNLVSSFYGTGHTKEIIREGGSVFMKLRQDEAGNIWAAGASFLAAGSNAFGLRSWPKNLITRLSADLPSGQIDSSFGQGGSFHFNPPIQANQGKIGQALQLQPDGKILLAATLGTDLFFDPKMCLIRLLPHGRIDTSFNTVGYRIMGNPASFQGTRDLELLPDGSLLIGGQIGNNALTLAKALPNGERDLQFGTNGFATGNSNEQRELHGGQFVVKSNGKIVQAGSQNGKIFLFQYLPNGKRDTSFGSIGRRVHLARPYCILRDIVIAPSGDLVVVGDFPFGTDSHSFIFCFDSNGFQKSNFGTNGFFLVDLPGSSDYGFSVLPLANGDLLLGGAAGNQATAVRLLSNLALSSTDDWQESSKFYPFIYPNPISSFAKLQLELNHPQQVNISLLNLQGQKVDMLYSGELFPGKHELALSFSQALSQGYYLLKIQSERELAFIKVFVKK